MEQQFISQWEKSRELAAQAGVRMRPVTAEEAMNYGLIDRVITGHSEK